MLTMGQTGFAKAEMDAALAACAATYERMGRRRIAKSGAPGCSARRFRSPRGVMPALVRMNDLGCRAAGICRASSPGSTRSRAQRVRADLLSRSLLSERSRICGKAAKAYE